jgi:hypothetical protein
MVDFEERLLQAIVDLSAFVNDAKVVMDNAVKSLEGLVAAADDLRQRSADISERLAHVESRLSIPPPPAQSSDPAAVGSAGKSPTSPGTANIHKLWHDLSLIQAPHRRLVCLSVNYSCLMLMHAPSLRDSVLPEMWSLSEPDDHLPVTCIFVSRISMNDPVFTDGECLPAGRYISASLFLPCNQNLQNAEVASVTTTSTGEAI